jgi:hypothetical protein
LNNTREKTVKLLSRKKTRPGILKPNATAQSIVQCSCHQGIFIV